RPAGVRGETLARALGGVLRRRVGLGCGVGLLLRRLLVARRRGRGRSGLAGRRGPLLRVVGDVPAAALELNRGRRQQFVDGALAAQLADGQRLVRELLDLLEPPAAGVALILVKRHRLYSIT